VLRALTGPAPVVVLADPWTSRWWRPGRAGHRPGGRARGALVLLDVLTEDAADGPARSGAGAIPEARMRRHGLRWARLAARPPRGPDVLVLDRPRAAARSRWAELLGRPAG
jgi:hypothetical protein